MLHILNAFNFKHYFFLPPNPNGLNAISVCIQNLTPTFAYCDVPPSALHSQCHAQVKSLNMQQLLAKSLRKDPLNVAKSGLLTKQPTGSRLS